MHDLTVGSRNGDVTILQEFLISQAKGSAASALSAAGATGYFGQLTRAALAEYQKAVGIKPASGYFGPLTRAYLKSAGL
jgi:peptidoglycan hydrolase-like protein with peptidoglycan-binding domain